MKRNCLTLASVCLLTVIALTVCTQKFPGYKKTESGLYYKFYSQNTSASKPNQTDMLKVTMTCYFNDSVCFDIQQSGSQAYLQLKESLFPADLYEAFAMMHLGDTASFYIKADSMAIKYYEKNPEEVGLKADDYFRYEIKLKEIKTYEVFQEENDRMKKAMREHAMQEFTDFVETNLVGVTPESSGVYIIPLEPGKGPCPKKGDKVEVDFSAHLINGQFVGSTFDRFEKFSFVLGKCPAIPAWEVIVPKMRVGERVKAIIPFDLAYGEYSVGSIPAYSSFVYDIKLLKITTEEELRAEEEKALAALKAESEKAFADYVNANGIVDHTPSGLYYSKALVTDKAVPQEGQKVVITYVATFLDGTPLGNSDALDGDFEVLYGSGAVLKGLEEGIGLMHVGEKVRFVLPYTLAYGEQTYKNIPGCSNLVFDVELIEIK